LFQPEKHTYRYLLKEAEWCFMKSGEDDKQQFYINYLDGLSNWCNYFHIYPTKDDKKYEEELREESSIKNQDQE
jgi:hypothetical protein